jgi:hypothetical protein
MQIEAKVPFEEVRQIFLRDNPDPNFRATGYAFRLLNASDGQFLGNWSRVVLSPKDQFDIMLPVHRHEGFELVPESGLIVADTLGRLVLAPPSHECKLRIDQFSQEPSSPVYLSAIPLNRPDLPEFTDYRPLVARGYRGITHLDGLHRLLAYAISKRDRVVAYLAGSV